MTLLLKGSNQRDHVAEIADIAVRYLEMNSLQYSQVAQTLLNEVLTTVYLYGTSMTIHIQKFDMVDIDKE